MKKKILVLLLGVIMGLTASEHVYATDSNTKQIESEPAINVKITRGLKQVLINKYGEEITGNPKYDHGAPDRDLLEEEMTEDRTYYRYVYDDALTEEENQEQYIKLELQAIEDYNKRSRGTGETVTPNITDKGIATSEGTISITD